MSGLGQDVLYALRQIRLRPGLALVIVATLGGAIGVNTSLFSLFNTAFLRPWSVPESASVVAMRPSVSVAEWEHWAEHATSFRGLAATRSARFTRLGGRRAGSELVTAGYFDVLGVPIARGRAFGAEDEAGTTVVLGHHAWQTTFAADPDILGRTISLEGVAFTVVGIAAPGFEGPDNQRRHLWLPLAAEARLWPQGNADRDEARVEVFGRLVPGASAATTQAELATLSAAFRSEHRLAAAPILVRSTDRWSYSPPNARTYMAWQSMLAGVTFLTFIACANLANLMLARGYARRREIAVRLSIGATRGRLVRQLLVEAFVLALMAGALGVAISTWVPGEVLGTIPEMVEMVRFDFTPDHRVLAWALGVSTLACLVFGLLPALQCTRVSVGAALKDSHGITPPSLKTSLMSWQAIVSVASLVVAGLVLRSDGQRQLSEVARAFDGVVLVKLEYPRGYDAARQRLIASAFEEQLQARFGRANVAAAAGDPRPVAPGETRSLAVSPGYFGVLRMPFAAGRTFRGSDSSDRVVIVNEAFARHAWPDQDPVGRTLAAPGGSAPARQVIGVVRDGAFERVSYPPAEYHRVFLVREAGPGFMAQVMPLVARLDPAVTADVASGSAWIGAATRGPAMAAKIAGGFGVFSLMLATIGFFSLAQYAVRQKTREIGIRTALGAETRHVLRAVFEPTVRAMARGLILGGLAGLAIGFFMQRAALPAGVDPLDAVTYPAVALVLGLCGAVAAWVPARHALRITPTEALRYE